MSKLIDLTNEEYSAIIESRIMMAENILTEATQDEILQEVSNETAGKFKDFKKNYKEEMANYTKAMKEDNKADAKKALSNILKMIDELEEAVKKEPDDSSEKFKNYARYVIIGLVLGVGSLL